LSIASEARMVVDGRGNIKRDAHHIHQVDYQSRVTGRDPYRAG
jgi:hypothetical protein